MKKIKGFLCAASLVMAAVPALAACEPAEQHAMWLTIWAADKVVDLTRTQGKRWAQQMLEEYEADIGIRVTAVSESQAAANMITDVTSGADIFCFAQDQLARLRSAGALKEIIDETAKNKVLTENDETSVNAASITDSEGNKALVAYPLTSDNGYFMYYDKSFFTNPDDLLDLETIVAKCEEAGRTIYFNAADAWYNAAFFYAFGCHSTWYSNSNGLFYKYDDNYRSNSGIKAATALYNLLNTHKSVLVNDATASTAFSHKLGETPKGAVCVSGTWDYSDAKTLLGDNLGAVELPHVTVGEERVHLSSFSGCKLIGVKPQRDAEKGAYAEMLAEYLIAKEQQEERFDAFGWGPCNKEAQALQKVQDNVALKALNAQNKYSTMQGQYPLDWWSTSSGITKSLQDESCGGTRQEIIEILTKYEGAIQAFLNGDPDEA